MNPKGFKRIEILPDPPARRVFEPQYARRREMIRRALLVAVVVAMVAAVVILWGGQ